MKILMIDDESDALDISAPIFERINLHVVKALNAQEAIKALENDSDISLIITDIHMPGMNGLDMLAKIAEKRNLPPTIIVTGMPHDDYKERAKQLGVVAWITKPFTMQSMFTLVQKILRNEKS